MEKSTKSLSDLEIFIISVGLIVLGFYFFGGNSDTGTGCDNDDVVCVSQTHQPDATYQCKNLISKDTDYKQEWLSKRLFMFDQAGWADDTHNIIDYSGDNLKLNINNLWPTARYTCRFDISKNTVFDYKLDIN